MDFFQQIAVAIVVLVVLGAILFVAKQRGIAQLNFRSSGSGSLKRMQSLERLSLSATHSLHLVSVDGRAVLVAVSPGGCQILRNIEEGQTA